jgi:hypothetical protein
LKVKLANGKEFDCDYMDHSERYRQANVRILNTPIYEIAKVFSDPAETAQLWFENDYASGFTKLLSLIDDGDAIRVVLGKE